TARKPCDIRRKRENLFGCLRGKSRLRSFRRRASGVLAAEIAIHNAIVQRIETSRSSVVLGKHPSNASQRQGALSLTGVQMTVAARNLSGHELRTLFRRIRKDPKAETDIVR